MSTRYQRAEALRQEYIAMEQDPYKAPEQVEAAKQAWFKAVRELRESDMPPPEHTCGNSDIPWCSACDALRGKA